MSRRIGRGDRAYLERRGVQVVAKADLPYLTRAEERQARDRGLISFKFEHDTAMLSAIEEEKSKIKDVVAA